ncbi:hypothetical protein, partial [Salinibacterium sp.]|uniref:hypothetical protein n=1 Tax=Salinibacterium sp. TaxID=1915057 RepID=UPI00286ABEA8
FPGSVDLATARAVTIDFTVLATGMDRVMFKEGDAIFISAGLALDVALVLHTQDKQGSRLVDRPIPRAWTWTTPVQFDLSILDVYQKLEMEARYSIARPDSPLDRTDLLCAATAIVYQSPLYTRKPEAYAELKNGLKVIEYGPTRNAKVARERKANGGERSSAELAILRGPAPGAHPDNAQARAHMTFPHESAPAVELLRAAYDAGHAFDDTAVEWVRRSATEPEAARFVAWLLDEVTTNTDPSWRIGLLAQAPLLAQAVRTDEVWHADAMMSLNQLIGNIRRNSTTPTPDEAREHQLASIAYPLWGNWPVDLGHDRMFDIEQEPDNEYLMSWYRIYLALAGLPEYIIAAELTAIAKGTGAPSRARIEELRGPTAADQ